MPIWIGCSITLLDSIPHHGMPATHSLDPGHLCLSLSPCSGSVGPPCLLGPHRTFTSVFSLESPLATPILWMFYPASSCRCHVPTGWYPLSALWPLLPPVLAASLTNVCVRVTRPSHAVGAVQAGLCPVTIWPHCLALFFFLLPLPSAIIVLCLSVSYITKQYPWGQCLSLAVTAESQWFWQCLVHESSMKIGGIHQSINDWFRQFVKWLASRAWRQMRWNTW